MSDTKDSATQSRTTGNDIEQFRAEHMRLMRALEQAETRNDLVLEATNDGVWDWDLTTNHCFFSRRWKGILGYAEHEVEDQAPAFFALIHHEDAGRVAAAVQAHHERQVPYDIVFRMRAKGGEWREIQARGQAIWDGEGRALRMAGVHTDITERRKRERERLRDEELIRLQRETIAALGVPILQVWEGIVCMPIVGAVDGARASQMTASLLDRVARAAARFAIIDLTGAVFREEIREHLARLTRSLRLIGTQGVLCGISPAVAQSLVGRGFEVHDAPTFRDLSDALRHCLHGVRL